MRNPFSQVGQPVVGPFFVGRVGYLRILESALLNSAQISLTGLGRVGKTCLARETFQRMQHSRPADTFGVVNTNEWQCQSDLWREILSELFPDRLLSEEWPKDGTDSYLKFRSILRRERKSPGEKYLLLDEFDAIRDYSDASLIIDRIREIACSKDRYGLSFLIVSRRSLARIQSECSGSNLYGICQNITLLPFTKSELRSLCNLAAPVSEEGLDKLFSISGGIPYLAAAILNKSVATTSELPQIDTSIINDALEDSRSDIYGTFEQIKAFLNADNLWLPLCREFIPPKIEETSVRELAELKRYGLLSDTTDSGCLSDWLCDYLHSCHKHVSMWEPLANFEQAMRNVVKKCLVFLYGENWTVSAPERKDYYSRLFPKLQKLRLQEQTVFLLGNESDLLEYSYPGTLKDIVMTEWESYFHKVFDLPEADFVSLMDAICLIRNPTNHYRRNDLIPPSAKLRAEEAINILMPFLFPTDD